MSSKSPIAELATGIMEIAWRVIVICAGIYLILIGVERAYSFGHGLLYDHAMEAAPGTDVALEITFMDDADSVGEKLLRAGLIDNLDAYRLQYRLYQADIQMGSYTLNTSMKLSEILTYLTEEGVKLSELREKNLVVESQTEAETEDDVIGGDEDAADHLAETEGELAAQEDAVEVGVGDEGA